MQNAAWLIAMILFREYASKNLSRWIKDLGILYIF